MSLGLRRTEEGVISSAYEGQPLELDLASQMGVCQVRERSEYLPFNLKPFSCHHCQGQPQHLDSVFSSCDIMRRLRISVSLTSLKDITGHKQES